MINNKQNRNFDAQSSYYEDENTRRNIEHENEFLHSGAGAYHIRYNDMRSEEISRRNQEILKNLKNLYISKNVAIIFITSIVLSILTSTNDIVPGIIVWNTIIFILIVVYYRVSSKIKVRPEINRDQAIRQSARDHAYRRR